MKLIRLSGKYGKGRFAMVDDRAYDFLNRWKWHVRKNKNNFYVARSVMGGTIFMHTVVLYPPNNKIIIDHIDKDGLNNQEYNLRYSTSGQNSANRRPRKNGSSKYLGVSLDRNEHRKTNGKGKIWRSSICSNYKQIYLGNYETEQGAALAYNLAAEKYHGNFASPNII